ncbi:MAG: hypothetical protein N2450_00085 [bacterium]|nr:hypothetical protein [bacterium]
MKFSILLSLLFWLPIITFAQMDEGEPPPDELPPVPPDWSEKFYTVLVAQMTKVLDIKPNQATNFFPTFNQFYNDFMELKKDEREIMVKLRRMGAPNSEATSAEVSKTLKSFQQLQEKKLKLLDRFLEFSVNHLEPWQAARIHPFLMRFNERIEQAVRERVREKMHEQNPRRMHRMRP